MPVVKGRESLPQIGGANLAPRYARWFSVLAENAEPGLYGLPFARPEFALADTLLASHRGRGGDIWRPDVDDIDLPDAEALEKVRQALRALGAKEDEVELLTGELIVPEHGDVIRY